MGGTDNHLLVADLRGKHITGKDFQNALDYVGITSGVRIGLTAVSKRGLKEPEIKQIASIMNRVAENSNDTAKLDELKAGGFRISEMSGLF